MFSEGFQERGDTKCCSPGARFGCQLRPQTSSSPHDRLCDCTDRWKSVNEPPIWLTSGNTSGVAYLSCVPATEHGPTSLADAPPQDLKVLVKRVETMHRDPDFCPSVAGAPIRLGGRRPMALSCRDAILSALIEEASETKPADG